MRPTEARRRFGAASIARLATVRPDGSPHLVPVTFALDGNTVWWAVDQKPKQRTRLQRLVNLEVDPRVSLLVDHYDSDWSALWWVRADGTARVVSGAEAARGMERLSAKYPTYQTQLPQGPVVGIDITRWRGWSAAEAEGIRLEPG